MLFVPPPLRLACPQGFQLSPAVLTGRSQGALGPSGRAGSQVSPGCNPCQGHIEHPLCTPPRTNTLPSQRPLQPHSHLILSPSLAHHLSLSPALDGSLEACPGALPSHDYFPLKNQTGAQMPKSALPLGPRCATCSPLPACPSLDWVEQTQTLGGKSLVHKGRRRPSSHPRKGASHLSHSPHSHLVHLHVSLWGGWNHAVPSGPRGASRGAWLWPAGHRK